MPNREITLSMKKQFSEALKKRIACMPFDKITVTELSEDCSVNRQTFYYHFEDIFDLANWCFRNEAEVILGFDEEPFDWKKSVSSLINYIDENNDMCVSLLNSMGHRTLKKTFSDSTERLIRKVISACAPVSEMEISEEELEFNIMFYSMAVSGLLEKYILNELNISSEKLICYIESIIIKNTGFAK
ncbi:MAG: TetR/AcrR family transcriptional regulator C-terminal domain-containing protein [Oscillospiraceae bacterium]|nr:TetR/AcrR family transcriptional regulator C-terminal domain-containing protein [Oscillospiraceae bacterium]